MAQSETTLTSSFPVKVLTVCLVITMALFAVLSWLIWSSYRDFKTTQIRDFRLQKLSGIIIHLDEALTMSARMAAVTEDLWWEKRYRRFEPQLDAAIKEAKVLAQRTFEGAAAAQTDNANVKLVAMENRAFGLVRKGNGEAAASLLSGEQYSVEKRLYKEGISQITDALERSAQSSLKRQRWRGLFAVTSIVVALPILLFVWLCALRMMSRHISERNRVEKALREGEKRYRDLVDNSLVGIYRTNLKGDILYVNKALAKMLEFESPEEMMLDNVLVKYKDYKDREILIETLKELGRVNDFQFDLLTKTEKTHNVLLSAALEGDTLSGMILDITERVQAEKALRERTEALERSNRELEQFAYVASHDLQEPLRTVASYTQLLARRYKGKLDSDADEFIGYAVDGATRMKQLINDLLDYSRVSTRGKDSEPTDCEVVFERSLINLQAAVEESEAEVTHTPLPTVMADDFQMGQLFQNLIGNAIKFRGEDPPHIHVSAAEKNGEWIFSVRDNGIGVEPKYADRIFVIFQRLHNKGKYPGTGIGLATCKKIVERHGGRMWVESEREKGSTFYFTIPVGGS